MVVNSLFYAFFVHAHIFRTKVSFLTFTIINVNIEKNSHVKTNKTLNIIDKRKEGHIFIKYLILQITGSILHYIYVQYAA